MKRALVLYVPVLHAGYLQLFEKYRGTAEILYILGEDIVAEFSPFHKEIRSLKPDYAKTLIEALAIFPIVKILNKSSMNDLQGAEIVTITDETCRKALESYLPENKIAYESVFLRWDEKNVKSATDVKYDRASSVPFDQAMCAEAANEAEKSSDWWRHVGAVIVKDNKIIASGHNHHIPSDHTPYMNGDPRDVITSGTLNLVYTSLHAEQSIIAESARNGVSLEGTDMYLNVFPCPLCAKLMVTAGIKKCFFKTGSAWLDAESVLRAGGVEIVWVKP
jgi:dCMP deaminase